MRVRALLLVVTSVILPALAACGGGSVSPPALAYSLPTATSVRYVTGDTSSVAVDAGGQMIEAAAASEATLSVAFARSERGIRVTMTVDEYAARASNPMASTSANASDIDGPLVFTLDRRGYVSGIEQPKVSQKGATFFQSLVIANTFFPHLPGRAVALGETWTDTTTFEGRQGPGEVDGTRVLTHTLVGDTLVLGRSLLRIDVEGTVEMHVKGESSGMELEQTVTGTVKGWALWDSQAGLLAESFSETEASGSMNVSAAPYPLAIELTQRSHTTLQDGM